MKSTPTPLPKPESIDMAAVLADFCAGRIDLVCVLGPTASGKTKYAVHLAQEICAMAELGYFEGCPQRMTGGEGRTIKGVEIISADSRQVYRGMDIGTGKDLAEYGDIPYHLIDIADPGEQYNVYRFQEDFRKAKEDILSRGCLPILCGGTGLYINAVTAGYSFGGEKTSLSEASGDYSKTFFIGTLVDRETRNARIDRRLDVRLEEGMAEEMKKLLDSGVPTEVLKAYGLEYKFVTEYVLGESSRDFMREHLAIAIHQFAKRQMTWFRGMERAGARIHWVEV